MKKALLAATLLSGLSAANAQTAATPGQGSVAANGSSWTVSIDGHVMTDGQAVPGGGQTSAIEAVNGIVWGQDNGQGPVCPGCWFQLNGQNWTPEPGKTPSADVAPLAATTNPPAPSVDPPATAVNPPVNLFGCSTTTPNTAHLVGGSFGAINGQIYNPDGTPFIAHGVNVYGHDLASISASLNNTLPGTNFIRVVTRPLLDPSAYKAFVDQMTAQGIVVEFEDHPNGGGAVDAGPPQGIAAESAWYASMAAAFKNNPYVWFGTFNEPKVTPGLSAWQQATYSAIRGTGNNNPIMLEVAGSRPINLQQGLDPSVYATMHNVIWDVHAYNYQSNYSADQGTVDANVKAMIAAAQTIRSGDGLMPVIIGEYGNSTTGGVASDPGGMQEVKAVENSGVGSAAFTWTTGIAPGNMLRNGNGSLTAYGQATAAFDKTSGATGCAQTLTPGAATSITQPITAPSLAAAATDQTAPATTTASTDQTAPPLTPNALSVADVAALATQ